MISSYFEELIHKGEAAPRTHVIGGKGTGSNLLKVLPNHYIIIHHLKAFAFYDFQEDPNGDVLTRSTFQMHLYSSTSRNSYICRSDIGQDAGGNNIPRGVFDFDTYLIHEFDVNIEFVIAPRVSQIVTDVNIPSPRQPTLKKPNGYKTANTSVKNKFGFPEPFINYANTKRFSEVGGDSEVRSANGLFFPVVDGTTTLTPNPNLQPLANGQYAYPILNIDYIQMQKPKNYNVPSSS